MVPAGIATDDTAKAFFADCVSSRRLVSFFDFENSAPSSKVSTGTSSSVC